MPHRVARLTKQVFDIALAVLILLLLSPIVVLAALTVLLESGGPVFFRQERAGMHGRPFVIFKLRTMRADAPAPEAVGQVDGSHALVTPSGRLFRRLKVDEVIQLVNVIRGEMSLVGPRPTLPSQVAEYGPSERERLEVLPGLTGWAQVNGNVQLSWPERITLDRWYVRHWSLALDLRILFKTIAVVLVGERIDTEALARARAEGL